jgi:hypothetical protein
MKSGNGRSARAGRRGGRTVEDKNGAGRTLGGERTGLSAPFVPMSWWEALILGMGATGGGDE